MAIITTTEAGKKLGVTRERIWQLIRNGELKATRFGRVWMIDTKDLKAVERRPIGRPPVANPIRPRPRKGDQRK